MRDEDWDDFRLALAIGRAGTFARAARHLKVNESTIARRLAAAENRFGTRLFERVDGTLTPTADGSELIHHAEAIEGSIQTARTTLFGLDRQAVGRVRVTTVPLIANRILAPSLGPLLHEHKGLTIDLIADPRDFSLTKREADIALRLARPTNEMTVVATRVAVLDYALYAGVASDPVPLPFLTYDDAMRDLPQSRWLQTEMAATGAPAPPVRVHDAETLLACLKSGLGKSLLPSCIADSVGGLRRIDSSRPCPNREVWLMVHPDLRKLVRIQVVSNWIKGVFSALGTGSSAGT
ncbi:MAG: LysR family transcriptional regulator [Pseudomonadota bacterium]